MEQTSPSVETPLLRKVRKLALAIREAGGRALLVGGFVRDELLGFDPKDADLEVYGLEAPELRAVLEKHGRVGAVGESFRVYKLTWFDNKVRHELDVALPRRDKKVGEGHKGFEVEGDPFATVEDAARRRDFTVNAILKDPLTDELIDPYGGVADLRDHVLRAVDGQHFGEDSLRVLRAVQFAARFEMTIEPGTVEICRDTPLDDLPRERVWGEFEKWLLKSERPSIGWNAGRQLAVFERLFPDLEVAAERYGDAIPEALDRAASMRADWPTEKNTALMLAVLGSHLGSERTEQLLEGLNIHKMRGGPSAVDVRQLVLQLIPERNRVRDWYAKGDVELYEFRYLSARVEPKLVLALARARGQTEAADWFEAKLVQAEVLDGPPAKLLLGRDLLPHGVTPGPKLGVILMDVYLAQLRYEVTTKEEALTLGLELWSRA